MRSISGSTHWRGHWGVGDRRPGAVLPRWLERCRQRAALASLDDRLLRDVGLTAGEAQAEAAKPFWRA